MLPLLFTVLGLLVSACARLSEAAEAHRTLMLPTRIPLALIPLSSSMSYEVLMLVVSVQRTADVSSWNSRIQRV